MLLACKKNLVAEVPNSIDGSDRFYSVARQNISDHIHYNQCLYSLLSLVKIDQLLLFRISSDDVIFLFSGLLDVARRTYTEIVDDISGKSISKMFIS